MGRQGQGREQAAAHSSIALLQERFRQLQRMKEMREEKELQRVLAAEPRQQQATIVDVTDHEQQPRWFYHPELLRPLHGLPKPIRSFQYSSTGQYHVEGSASDASFSTGVWQQRPAGLCTAVNFPEDKDVDTSLHL